MVYALGKPSPLSRSSGLAWWTPESNSRSSVPSSDPRAGLRQISSGSKLADTNFPAEPKPGAWWGYSGQRAKLGHRNVGFDEYAVVLQAGAALMPAASPR